MRYCRLVETVKGIAPGGSNIGGGVFAIFCRLCYNVSIRNEKGVERMKALVCKSCSATGLLIRDGYAVCPYCDTKFLLDRETAGSLGGRSGSHFTFSSHGSSSISLDSDVQRLLDKCRRDPRNARKYANLILDIDPDNEEASKYLR